MLGFTHYLQTFQAQEQVSACPACPNKAQWGCGGGLTQRSGDCSGLLQKKQARAAGPSKDRLLVECDWKDLITESSGFNRNTLLGWDVFFLFLSDFPFYFPLPILSSFLSLLPLSLSSFYLSLYTCKY